MSHDISKIDSLLLPKRTEKRRVIYLGEGIICKIKIGSQSFQMPIIDISAYGLAVVESTSKLSSRLINGATVEIIFGKPLIETFKIKAKVVNMTEVILSGKKLKRFGLQFETTDFAELDQFRDKLNKKIFVLNKAIRPQAYAEDPFFYNEIVILQINSFSKDGVEVEVSARCKTILPSQILELNIHIPGRGTFIVKAKNSNFIYRSKKDQKITLYASFVNPSVGFLQAVSEFILMFSEETPSLVELKKLGFSVGNLSNATTITYSHLSENALQDHGLIPSLVSMPRQKKPDQLQTEAKARSLTCRIGSAVASYCDLIFVDQFQQESLFKQFGHKIHPKLEQHNYVELVNFYISDGVALVDFFIPLLQHVVRIAAQGRASFIMLEASPKILELLKKIGFKESGSTIKLKQNGKSQEIHLCYLPIHQVVTNQTRVVGAQVWDKIYKSLYLYLKKNPKALKLGKG